MKATFLLSIALFFAFQSVYCQNENLKFNEQTLTLDTLYYNIVQIQCPKANNMVSYGTGNIIRHHNKFYLLTAKHVAIEMGNSTKVIFPDNPPYDVLLTLLTQNISLKWIHHPIADISLIEIKPFSDYFNGRLNKYSLSSKFLYKEVLLPINMPVIFFGFIQDYKGKNMSSMLIGANTATSFISIVRDGIVQDALFLDKPSTQGCSGSGAFINVVTGTGGIFTNGITDSYLIGIVSGTKSDDTGGKLAYIVPAHYIFELLDK